MPTCKLCLSEATLRNSHIHPEFLYRDLYDDSHKLIAVTGEGPKGFAVLQKGLREPLLADCCETRLNREFENPFLQTWIDAGVPNSLLDKGRIYPIKISDYSRFKLFHLSILLRASWSRLQTYANVSLGPKHEERIRRMLLSNDPGETWRYPIFGYAVADTLRRKPLPLVSPYESIEFDSIRMYSSIYAGVAWNIGVASHPSRETAALGIQPDGTLPVIVSDFRDVFEANRAADKLRGAGSTTRR